MKKLLTASLVFSLFTLLLSAEEKNWNRNWEFQIGDVGANAEGFTPCFLPHSFSTPYFLGSHFYMGEGWYRKDLTPEDYGNAVNVFLDFEGVFQVAEVFLDDKKIGEHRSGYTGFRVDLTPHLKRGKTQQIAVRVCNRWNSQIAPRAGEHIFTGGINRDVWLRTCGNVYLERNSVVVTTPEVSEKKAKVNVRYSVKNTSKKAERVKVVVELRYDGKFLTDSSFSKTIPAGKTEKNNLTITVLNPKLWSPETPNLYTVTVKVFSEKDQKKASDKWRGNVGFRWFEWTADKGFFLNGKHVFLLGANVHQDCAGWGDAMTNASHERDVKMMKDAGFNFIRGSHYPHDPAFLSACDKYGMLFWSEGGVWGMGGQKVGDERWNSPAIPHKAEDQPAFADSAETLVREMVRDARNHPSVIAWSVCNEPFFLPGDLIEPSKKLVSRLLLAVKEEDPTRPAAVGGVQRAGFDQLPEAKVVGYNGDGARIFKNPKKPNLVAEYGSTIATRPGKFIPGWGDFANERPAWRAGAAIWCGFDHGSIWSAGSRMGIVDYFRLPKNSWHWYRKELLGIEPPAQKEQGTPAKLLLMSDKKLLTSCSGEDDALLQINIADKNGKPLANNVPVRLRIVSGPGEFPTGKSIEFKPNSDIAILDGTAAITFRSYFNGTTKIVAESAGLDSAEIIIETKDTRTRDADKEFVAGKSIETPDRPYLGAYKPGKQLAPSQNVSRANLAENRPCRASSNDTQAPRANDGDLKNAWTPAENDKSPSWTLDFEFIFNLAEAQISVGNIADVSAIRFDVSTDRTTWTPVKIAKREKLKGGLTKYVFDAGTPRAKYFRVSFPKDSKPQLHEVRVFGK